MARPHKVTINCLLQTTDRPTTRPDTHYHTCFAYKEACSVLGVRCDAPPYPRPALPPAQLPSMQPCPLPSAPAGAPAPPAAHRRRPPRRVTEALHPAAALPPSQQGRGPRGRGAAAGPCTRARRCQERHMPVQLGVLPLVLNHQVLEASAQKLPVADGAGPAACGPAAVQPGSALGRWGTSAQEGPASTMGMHQGARIKTNACMQACQVCQVLRFHSIHAMQKANGSLMHTCTKQYMPTW